MSKDSPSPVTMKYGRPMHLTKNQTVQRPQKRRIRLKFKHIYVSFMIGAFIWICLLTSGLKRLNDTPLHGNDRALHDGPSDTKTEIQTKQKTKPSWCDRIIKARSTLDVGLGITYPCEKLRPAVSAVVVFLTDGVPKDKSDHRVFSSEDYVKGLLALGMSLRKHMTRDDTHKLLLIREGFTLPPNDLSDLEAVGWTIGTAPAIDILPRYLPRFPRYKTVYTKLAVIGLSEYKCALLLDADTLVLGSINDFLSCDVFDRPEYRLAGTIDYYRQRWMHINTGSVLWRTSAEEMNRVYNLTKDKKFMRKFESDQIFVNTVYPDRMDKEKNEMLLKSPEAHRDEWGSIVALPWEYNAQTHVEKELPEFWNEHLDQVKILHYTQKKGWQCEERHDGPPPGEAKKCNAKDPLCACREGWRWWDDLREAKKLVGSS
mmetsp:Transcript_52971/g.63782  ORF Transcript_52971/g.63782 Transcript_52971/m.63782 type:complete len:429 (+) Transcript_52971:58-1344(+)